MLEIEDGEVVCSECMKDCSTTGSKCMKDHSTTIEFDILECANGAVHEHLTDDDESEDSDGSCGGLIGCWLFLKF